MLHTAQSTARILSVYQWIIATTLRSSTAHHSATERLREAFMTVQGVSVLRSNIARALCAVWSFRARGSLLRKRLRRGGLTGRRVVRLRLFVASRADAPARETCGLLHHPLRRPRRPTVGETCCPGCAIEAPAPSRVAAISRCVREATETRTAPDRPLSGRAKRAPVRSAATKTEAGL